MFINCNKCAALVGDVDHGGDYVCVGAGVYGKFLQNFAVKFNLLSLKYAVKLKLL